MLFKQLYLYTVKDKKLPIGEGFAALGDNPALGTRLVIYSDSDWALEYVDRKSYSENAIFMIGGLVARFVLNQPLVAVSSTGAEYFIMHDAYTDGVDIYHFPN